MQPIVIDKPYQFIAPRYSRGWHHAVRKIMPWHLRKEYGVTAVECIGVEKLRASLDAGHGVVIVANHCRPCDPMVLDGLAAALRRPFHVIASWHLFMANRIQRFLVPRIGAFSVYREGMDRESLKCAVKTVADGKFPLVIFAEGIVTRCNDRLVNLMEGPAFISRAAAKQGGKVVIHPVFIRYFFEGNLGQTITPVIEEIERRLSWQPQVHLSPRDRIRKAGGALLYLKEMEYLQAPQTGTLRERLRRLENHLLTPLEDRCCAGRHDGDAMARVKRLRTAILPQMVNGNMDGQDRASRWRLLADLYLIQQLHCYPGDYIENPTPERILETVERYEEDLTDKVRAHSPLRAVITVGDAIEVSAERVRGQNKSQEPDPITTEIRQRMEELLELSKACRRVAPTGTDLQ